MRTIMFDDEIGKIVSRITRDFETKAVIFFGPALNDDSVPKDHLSIAVVIDTSLNLKQRGLAVRRSIGNTDIPIELLVFTPEEAESQKRIPWSMVNDILSSGKVVYGSI